MRYLIHTLILLVLLIPEFSAQVPKLRFVDPVSGFNQPVDITGAEDGSERLFVVERAGLVRIYDQAAESVLAANFLDISSFVLDNTGERGLLGIAFHPDYENNGFFYVNYTTVAREGRVAGSTVIARFMADPGANTVDANTELVLLNVRLCNNPILPTVLKAFIFENPRIHY